MQTTVTRIAVATMLVATVFAAPASAQTDARAVSAAPAAAPVAPTIATKLAASFYGFVELDAIHDSTESFNDLAGNATIARGNYAASHGRTLFGVRNSRLGFKLNGPDSDLVRTSAILEMDFMGNQPSPISEAGFVTSPTFRIRHFAVKLETPLVDVLLGQYWQLFGWQSMYHPNTVEIQGVPGQVYSRSPQIRLQRAFKTQALTIELAAAAVRPAQRDSGVPDGQAGLRLVLDHWKGLHTAGGTGTALDGASLAVSGIYRRFEVASFEPNPTTSRSKRGSGVSIDALLPLLPATASRKGNALTFTGSFVRGTGIADLYTGLTGGLTFPSLANYSPNVDNGLVAFDGQGQLHTINWVSYLAGLQYYLPPSGRIWLSANFSAMRSTNLASFAKLAGTAGKVFDRSYWADGNVFVDVNQAVRLGAELAWFRQTYVDGQTARNYRGQLSAFYIF